jgi:hypothetical protein
MSLIHPDRMQTVLGRYAVGGPDCLVDPSLVSVAQDYRRQAQARMKPLDPKDIAKLPPAELGGYHVSLKIDGEFNVLVYQDGEAILVNPGGTVRAGLPEVERVAWHLHAAGVRRALVAGELFWERPDGGRERVHDVVRVARNPQSDAELLDLHFAAFDLLDLDGPRSESPEQTYASLQTLHLNTPPYYLAKSLPEIQWQFDHWTRAGHEGIVIRSDTAGSFKVKPRHSIDAAVIGFTEDPETPGRMHDLLVALMRPDGTYQVLGRVGGGFSDQDRRDWCCDLKDWIVESDYVETNDGVAYHMVWPQHVIEISVLDLISQSTRGQPILAACLDWKSQVRDPNAQMSQVAGCWYRLCKLPLVAMISPQFVCRREDKQPHLSADLRLSQVADLVEVPLVDRDARDVQLPKSELLRRQAWTKTLKGQTMVRKLVMWQTNKATQVLAGGPADFPAYVIAVTDYSPGRAESLQRDVRVSNSRAQIDELWNQLVKEKVVKGWMAA